MSEINWRERAMKMQHEVSQLKQEVAALNNAMEGNWPDCMTWLQRKAHTQRAALRKLHEKYHPEGFVS